MSSPLRTARFMRRVALITWAPIQLSIPTAHRGRLPQSIAGRHSLPVQRTNEVMIAQVTVL